MLPLIMAAAAVIFGACKSDPEPPTSPSQKNKEPTSSTSGIPLPSGSASQGTTYSSACLVSAPCLEGEREAAVLDYVGAAYSHKASNRFDGLLSHRERSEVEQRLGAIAVDTALQPYLSAARKKFFLDDGPPPFSVAVCQNDPNFFTREFTSSTLGRGIFLGTLHYCGERIGNMYGQYEIEIASQPEDWVFFLENYSDPFTKNLKGEEGSLMQHLSRALDIPLEDPVLPFPKVVREIARKYSETPEGVGALLFLNAMLFQPSDDDYMRRLQSFAKQSNLEFNALLRAIKSLDALPANEAKRKIDEVMPRYSSVISETSPELIRDTLKSRGKRNAIYIVGHHHLDLEERVYGKQP